MSHDGSEGFTGVEEDASSAAKSQEPRIKNSTSPDAIGEVLDPPEAQDLGIKNSTVACSEDMADSDGQRCLSTRAGTTLDSAKNPVLDLSEARDLGIKNSTCRGAEEDGVSHATGFSKSSGAGIGFEQPRRYGTTPRNAKNAVLGPPNAQHRGIKSSNLGIGISIPKQEVAEGPSDHLSPSSRQPSRRRKSRRPKRFTAKEESSKDGAISADAKSHVLDEYITSQIDNSQENTPEVAENITADWISEEQANEGFKIRDVKHYARRLRQLPAEAAAAAAAAVETRDASGANDLSISRDQGSALPATTEPPEASGKGTEDGAAAPDGSGKRSSSHIMILGGSLVCAAIACALYFFAYRKAETGLPNEHKK